jgi:hypothetical protein
MITIIIESINNHHRSQSQLGCTIVIIIFIILLKRNTYDGTPRPTNTIIEKMIPNYVFEAARMWNKN